MSDDATASQFNGLLDGRAADRKVMRRLAHASKLDTLHQLSEAKAPGHSNAGDPSGPKKQDE